MAPRTGSKQDGEQVLVDFDPEADDSFGDGSVSGSQDEDGVEVEDNAREHYVDVDKSRLRKPKNAPLGSQYRGSRISRDAVTDDEDGDDPFTKGFDDEDSADEEEIIVGDDSSEAELVNGNSELEDETSGTDLSEDAANEGRANEQALRAERVREAMQQTARDAPKIAATLSQANQADVERGRAVKKQRAAFDALLGSRMKLQKALVGVNTLAGLPRDELQRPTNDAAAAMQAAEAAAFKLWSSLDSFREELLTARTGEKRKRAVSTSRVPVSKLWSHMQTQEAECVERRNAILQKWSKKTQHQIAAPRRGLLSGNAPQTTVLDSIRQDLSDMPRLTSRARKARSCAPLQIANKITEDPAIYDDADFYGLMLKELLEQKSADSITASNIDLSFQMRREAKAKRNVDVKASKGRKLRYTVHEKLQNFMAPEDRRTWGQRQADELFGSLFGQRVTLADDEREEDMEEDVDLAEAGLMLFKS
ncbi:hypothetical protein BAUCODRAFT_365746 [Baudoinia panamericana UAMH 10762]|uniref:Protein BFR2 n=1 Tax=Baudoinia panamericana (strain UAMH 10762) TaxID=717646 RepID=M2LZK7_BAUPA|nr:uncharacterized protein BAUCODRAFT_365746 [Baudoinia panamericana UAMH 10762]EMD00128.1 hypothetical protein BAUCODRAFT_365746 [Baudoinia panamericana UAMH 10762]